MTNEEAIETLRLQRIFTNTSNIDVEAINIAIESLRENTKLKAEINRLNGKSEMYRDMADSFCNSNIKLKAEIEQLKELIPRICETCQHENLCGTDEPCDNCKNSKNWILKAAQP